MENIKLIINFLGQLLPAINITLIVSVSSIILGSLLGLLLAAARLSESVVLRVLASVYVSVIRARRRLS
ncbi:hypothetical protein NBRC111894_1635 [Sporolactobacillus inulinus]|uniref:Amino acid ABC transporter, permease protein n=1 Tax=Sporolactobacillus inulinus TaxID=2078 RepID=A0A4Y1ZAX5_9BACL|nr:hypothetical protein [Sporolactobacillus inulinus]GAY76081.1 hypothetical protein NBRC111894_1635 [Sporolactobacillus inulinus]